MGKFKSTKVIELGSCAFRQPKARSHCSFLHGYRLTAKFWFGCNELDENNWCIDFGSLRVLKQKLQKQFDHTTCIDKNDPFLDHFIDLGKKGIIDIRVMDGVGIEMFAKYCFDISNMFIQAATNDRCFVEKVEVWEHEKNSAIYSFETTETHTKPPTTKNNTTIETKNETVTETKKPEAVTTPPVVQPQKKSGHVPAPVGNVISKGIGNPFGGTSWSADNGDSMR